MPGSKWRTFNKKNIIYYSNMSGKGLKIWKILGKVREFLQAEKVGTLPFDPPMLSIALSKSMDLV